MFFKKKLISIITAAACILPVFVFTATIASDQIP